MKAGLSAIPVCSEDTRLEMHDSAEAGIPDSTIRKSILNTCLPYKIRGFRNKGGLLTLFWSFSGFLLFHYAFLRHSDLQYYLVISTVFYPFAGWLADACYGRYKVIRYSMRIVLLAVLTFNCVLVVCGYFQLESHCGHSGKSKHLYQKFLRAIKGIMSATGLFGMAGFQANLFQLGIDQFANAPSTEISSYIGWYVWIIFLSRVFVSYTQVCSNKNEELTFLSISIFLALTVVLDIFLNHWLIREKVLHNPLKLIYNVLSYAVKNKYPHLRSAFTHWENKSYYSRIDLGKSKYGGPFTTEQVEDVKTFFRVFLIISVASILMGLCIILENAFVDLSKHYSNGDFCDNCKESKNWNDCYEHESVVGLANLLMVGFIPVFEFVVYPLFRKCSACAKFSIMYRFLLGIFLLSLYQIYIMSLEAVAVSSFHNATCFMAFANPTHPKIRPLQQVRIDYRWLMFSKVFSAGSMYLLITSGIEFMCAQAPYSMKGLFSGIVYCLSGITASIAYGLWMWIHKHMDKVTNIHFLNYTCGVWFYSLSFAFTIFLLCIGFVLVRWYSFRQRDEDVHSEQVDYFDRYHMHTKH